MYLVKTPALIKNLFSDYVWEMPTNDNEVFITFDDGHRNNFELRHALEKYQVPVTIFLVSNVMNSKKHRSQGRETDSANRHSPDPFDTFSKWNLHPREI
jgi:peptidoglycan/xylan/chitin deacetylase (PgdA/CDA1 family)